MFISPLRFDLLLYMSSYLTLWSIYKNRTGHIFVFFIKKSRKHITFYKQIIILYTYKNKSCYTVYKTSFLFNTCISILNDLSSGRTYVNIDVHALRARLGLETT